MATLPGNIMVAVVASSTDPASPAAQKTRAVAFPTYSASLPNGEGTRIYQMRAKDTGAGLVSWVTTDPNASYPGVPVGSIIQKEIGSVLPT